MRWQYMHGVLDPAMVSPDGQTLDNFYLSRAGADEIQLDLFADYASNVALHPQFMSISAPTNHRVWRHGAGTTRSSCRRGPRHSNATFRTGSCASSILGISRWKHTRGK